MRITGNADLIPGQTTLMSRRPAPRSHVLAFALLLTTILLVTLPLAAGGYGSNQDAARSAQASETFFLTGVYHTSRLPGNPVYELLLTTVVPWADSLGANLLNLGFYLACLAAFYRLVRRQEQGLLLTALFALTPNILVGAVTAKDFILGIALLLGAYAAVQKERYWLAALLCGLAIGCRLTNILFVLPLATYLWLTGVRPRAIALCAASSLLVGLVWFIPIFAQYHSGMFVLNPNHDSHLTRVLRFVYGLVGLFGLVPTVALAGLLFLYRRRIVHALAEIRRPASAPLVLEVTTVLLYVGLFALNANQIGYILVVVPFLYLIISRWLPPSWLAAFGVLAFVSGFVTLDLRQGSSGQRHLGVQPSWGPVVQEYIARQDMQRLRHGIGQCVPAPRAVVLTGLGAVLTFRNDALVRVSPTAISPLLDSAGIGEAANTSRLKRRSVFFVYALSGRNIRLLRTSGIPVYFFSEYLPSTEITEYGYNPYQGGLIRLDISGPTACYNRGA